MASRAIEQIVTGELKHYPEVEVELQNGGKHDRALFRLGKRTRFMTLPKTPSDHRAPENIKRDMRKTLVELGAKRSFGTIGAGSRGGKGRRTRTADAAVALNATGLIFVIPAASKALPRFKTPDNEPARHWTFEFRSSVDLKRPPQLAIKKAELPPGVEKAPGISSGWSTTAGGWVFKVSPKMHPALKNVSTFASIDVKLLHAGEDELIFSMPEGVFPTSYQPHHDETEAHPAPLPSQAWREPEEAPQEAPEEPEAPKPTKAPGEALAGILDKPIVLQMPRQSVSIEQAIALLNKKKLQLGNKLRFTIKEDGFLSAIHRID